jgi:hypothetical protein
MLLQIGVRLLLLSSEGVGIRSLLFSRKDIRIFKVPSKYTRKFATKDFLFVFMQYCYHSLGNVQLIPLYFSNVP